MTVQEVYKKAMEASEEQKSMHAENGYRTV